MIGAIFMSAIQLQILSDGITYVLPQKPWDEQQVPSGHGARQGERNEQVGTGETDDVLRVAAQVVRRPRRPKARTMARKRCIITDILNVFYDVCMMHIEKRERREKVDKSGPGDPARTISSIGGKAATFERRGKLDQSR
jgi:hypothetical protein